MERPWQRPQRAARQAFPARPTRPRSPCPSTSTAAASRRFRRASGFFDHMLEQLSRHSLIDMEIDTKGDLHVDDHHAVEISASSIGRGHFQSTGRSARHHALCLDRSRHGRDDDEGGGRSVRPALPRLERRLQRPEDRHFRYRAGARILPGARAECRHHAAYPQPLWRQQSPYSRDMLQSRCPRAAHGNRDRSAAGRPRAPRHKGTLA